MVGQIFYNQAKECAMAQENQENSGFNGAKGALLNENYFVSAGRNWLRLIENVFGDYDERKAIKNFANMVRIQMFAFGEKTEDEVILKRFSESAERVIKDIKKQITVFMPKEWHEQLMPLIKIDPEPLANIRSLKGKNIRSANNREVFEMLRLLEMSNYYFSWRQRYKNRDDKNIIGWLKSAGVIRELEEKEITIHLRPEDGWSCLGVNLEAEKRKIENTEKRTVLTLKYKIATIGRRRIKVLIEQRKKEEFPSFVRKFRDKQSFLPGIIPNQVIDIYGLRFAYQTISETMEGVDHFGLRSMHFNRNNKPKRKPLTNEESAGNLHLYSRIIWMGSQYYETQHLPAKEMFNIAFSTKEEAHDLYKLRWYLRGAFPHIFPREIYGIDWQDETVREKMKDHIIANIIAANKKTVGCESQGGGK